MTSCTLLLKCFCITLKTHRFKDYLYIKDLHHIKIIDYHRLLNIKDLQGLVNVPDALQLS